MAEPPDWLVALLERHRRLFFTDKWERLLEDFRVPLVIAGPSRMHLEASAVERETMMRQIRDRATALGVDRMLWICHEYAQHEAGPSALIEWKFQSGDREVSNSVHRYFFASDDPEHRIQMVERIHFPLIEGPPAPMA